MLQRIYEWFDDFDPIFLISISSLGVLGWGIQLLNPLTDVFVLYESQLSYFKDLYPNEWVWGVAGVLVGGMSLYGFIKQKKIICMFGLYGVLWFRILTILLVGFRTNFQSTGLYDFIAWVIISIALILKIKGEAWK